MVSTTVDKTPYFPEIGVIGLVPDEWGGPWMPREHVLTWLASYFHVLWIEPAKGWREQLSAGAKLNQVYYSSQEPIPGFSIYSPSKWLPKFYSPRLFDDFTTRKRLNLAKKLLADKGCKKFILYMWRPHFFSMMDKVSYDLSCYHIDDEYSFSEFDMPNNEIEIQLISKVDQVIIHSHALIQKKGNINPNTAYIPNGVDFLSYSMPAEEPEDLKKIPHPRIGYIGIIKKQLDIKLLYELAQKHADFSFVFVGPIGNVGDKSELLEKLQRLNNIYFLGAKAIDQLPSYTQHLDVCMLCYVVNGYTNYIYPLKLHEYLATGKPVIGSSINTLMEFQNVIKIANTVDEWSQALDYSLGDEANSQENIASRVKVAQEYDWNLLVKKIARIFCERLGREYLEKFNAIAG